MKTIRQSGLLPKCLSARVLIPPCKSRNFVAEQCRMTDLGCWTILLAQTLVSDQVLCRGKREYWEKEQQNLCAVTWQSISSVAWQDAAQSSHQCQWEDPFHAIEQETKGVAQADSKNPFSNQERGTYCDISCNWQSCTQADSGPKPSSVRHLRRANNSSLFSGSPWAYSR